MRDTRAVVETATHPPTPQTSKQGLDSVPLYGLQTARRGQHMPEMTIGELAKAAGVGVETVRFYERKRLIPRPKRPGSGFRKYNDEVARRLRFIRQAQGLGFSLTEIRQLLELRVDPKRSCADVKREAEAKISDIDEKIRTLRTMRAALLEITRTCSGEGPTSACPILDAIDSPRGTSN